MSKWLDGVKAAEYYIKINGIIAAGNYINTEIPINISVDNYEDQYCFGFIDYVNYYKEQVFNYKSSISNFHTLEETTLKLPLRKRLKDRKDSLSKYHFKENIMSTETICVLEEISSLDQEQGLYDIPNQS